MYQQSAEGNLYIKKNGEWKPSNLGCPTWKRRALSCHQALWPPSFKQPQFSTHACIDLKTIQGGFLSRSYNHQILKLSISFIANIQSILPSGHQRLTSPYRLCAFPAWIGDNRTPALVVWPRRKTGSSNFKIHHQLWIGVLINSLPVSNQWVLAHTEQIEWCNSPSLGAQSQSLPRCHYLPEVLFPCAEIQTLKCSFIGCT